MAMDAQTAEQRVCDDAGDGEPDLTNVCIMCEGMVRELHARALAAEARYRRRHANTIEALDNGDFFADAAEKWKARAEQAEAEVVRLRSQLETRGVGAAVSTERLPIREALGMAVREAWVAWAATQPDVAEHPSWLVPWAELPERDREVDRLIGEAVVRALPTDIEAPTSALPWMYDAPDYIVCVAGAEAVARVDGGWPADAAYIVAACNGYPGLLARLKAAEAERDELRVAVVEEVDIRKRSGEAILTTVRERDEARVAQANERARADVLMAERDEARAWVRRLAHDTQVITCAFCGESYPPGTPVHWHDALTAHVKVCTKRPMREAEAEIAELRAELAAVSAGASVEEEAAPHRRPAAARWTLDRKGGSVVLRGRVDVPVFGRYASALASAAPETADTYLPTLGQHSTAEERLLYGLPMVVALPVLYATAAKALRRLARPGAGEAETAAFRAALVACAKADPDSAEGLMAGPAMVNHYAPHQLIFGWAKELDKLRRLWTELQEKPAAAPAGMTRVFP